MSSSSSSDNRRPFLGSSSSSSSSRFAEAGWLQSLLSFRQYAVVSWSLLLFHFVIVYLSASFLLFAALSLTGLTAPYIVFLSFLTVRSSLHALLSVLRLRVPSLWYPSSALQRHITACLRLSRLLNIAALVYGALHYFVLEAADSGVGSSPVIPLLLAATLLSLLQPVCAIAVLRLCCRLPASRLSSFLPYVLTAPAAAVAPVALLPARTLPAALTASQLASLPCLEWQRARWQEESGSCAICLSELEPAALVRRLPCGHSFFHAPCVDIWLMKRATCPLCVRSCSLSDRAGSGGSSSTASTGAPSPSSGADEARCNRAGPDGA